MLSGAGAPPIRSPATQSQQPPPPPQQYEGEQQFHGVQPPMDPEEAPWHPPRHQQQYNTSTSEAELRSNYSNSGLSAADVLDDGRETTPPAVDPTLRATLGMELLRNSLRNGAVITQGVCGLFLMCSFWANYFWAFIVGLVAIGAAWSGYVHLSTAKDLRHNTCLCNPIDFASNFRSLQIALVPLSLISFVTGIVAAVLSRSKVVYVVFGILSALASIVLFASAIWALPKSRKLLKMMKADVEIVAVCNGGVGMYAPPPQRYYAAGSQSQSQMSLYSSPSQNPSMALSGPTTPYVAGDGGHAVSYGAVDQGYPHHHHQQQQQYPQHQPHPGVGVGGVGDVMQPGPPAPVYGGGSYDIVESPPETYSNNNDINGKV